MKKSLLSAIFLMGFAVLCHANEVRVIASVDRTQVAVGESVFLTVRILDGRGNIQAPQFPQLRDLDIHYTGRASRMSLVNGVSSSSLEFSYVVSPRRMGAYVIPALEVNVNGAAFQTNPVRIEVTDNGGGAYPSSSSSSTSSSSSSASPSQNVKVLDSRVPSGADTRIFSEAQLSKFSVYQNEQTLLNYALYTSYDTRYEGFETEPELSGFWIEEFPMEKEVPREMVSIQGRRYIKADIKKMALFPTSPGKYKIQPGKIKTTIKQDQQQDNVFDEFFNDSFFNGGNFFSKRETRILAPRELEIEVKPLPAEGKPKGFQGDVGIYQMSATLDKTEVKQNEPVKMTLVIEGQGNVDRVNRPHIPDLKGFRTYEADSKSEISRVNDMISGRKTFEVVFIPKEEGKMFIPPLEFSFFDPQKAQYNTLRTPNYPLNVLKGEASPALPDEVVSQRDLKKDVPMGEKDIHYIETKWSTGSKLEKWGNWMVVLLAGLNLFFLGLIGFAAYQKSRESFISQNRGLYRNQRARATAMAEISKLKKLMRAKDQAVHAEFFDHLEKSLNQYFADKWNLSAQGTARSEIERRLRESLRDEENLHQEIVGIYQLCDESRFGKGAIPESSRELAVRVFQKVVERLEKVKS